MTLPPQVHFCIQQLNQAGFEAYAVGGCVRDLLLGLTPQDFDLCTSATPDQICQVFSQFPLAENGRKHGTIGVIVDHSLYEITTFRTEGGYQDSRHPDWVEFVTSLQADLSRRDFTINAMAYAPDQGLQDPFGGQADLKNHVLRAVGDPQQRFREDALRILRGVRFGVRYGLVPENATEEAMAQTAPFMDQLAKERVFDELCKLLPLVKARDLLRFASILTQVLPELEPTLGFQQHSPHHAYDVFTHTAHVVAATEPDLALRWAALLHDVGKPPCFTLDSQGRGHFYGHAQVSAQIAEQILLGLKAPTALRKEVVLLVSQHMTPLEPDKKLLRRRMSKLGAPILRKLLALQQADFGSKGRQEPDPFGQVRALLQELEEEKACLSIHDLAVNGHDLMALGLNGPAIGKAQAYLLEQVLEEALPNEKNALLQAVKENIL